MTEREDYIIAVDEWQVLQERVITLEKERDAGRMALDAVREDRDRLWAERDEARAELEEYREKHQHGAAAALLVQNEYLGEQLEAAQQRIEQLEGALERIVEIDDIDDTNLTDRALLGEVRRAAREALAPQPSEGEE